MTDQAAQPSEIFTREVKDALEDLYDFAALERHAFARLMTAEQSLPGETGGQSLRRHILQAIETLNPGSQLTQHGPQSRAYDVLRLRYIEGLRLQEAAEELGISERQAYRHLHEAAESLVSVLWSRYPGLRQVAEASSPAEAGDIPRLENVQPTDIKELVIHAQAAVERLAVGRGVSLAITLPAGPVMVATNDAMARQILVSTISQCIQQTQASRIELELINTEAEIGVTLSFAPVLGMEDTLISNPVVDQLSARLGWTISHADQPDGRRAIRVEISAAARTLLVIDDDTGLARLIERYLTGLNLRLIVAHSGVEGIQLAQDIRPDLIILDVMMPGMDGWEVLQRLRTHPQTGGLSVIVCSIFDDPELAYSLGARLVLPKPISQVTFLEALRQTGVL